MTNCALPGICPAPKVLSNSGNQEPILIELERSGAILLFKRVLNRLSRPYGFNPFPRAFGNPLTAGTADRSAVFDKVYEKNFWGSAQSSSGLGSELDFTIAYRMELSALNFSHSESFSMTCLEPSLHGVPVIATRSGGTLQIHSRV